MMISRPPFNKSHAAMMAIITGDGIVFQMPDCYPGLYNSIMTLSVRTN
jgi:hypothetical protein